MLNKRDVTSETDLQEQIRLAPGQLIATRIKRARKTASLSHDRLGELIGGVSRQHLIKLEQAKHRPRAEMLERIAEATGKEIGWFLDPEVDPSPFPDDEDGAASGDAGRADRRARPAPRQRADARPAGELAA